MCAKLCFMNYFCHKQLREIGSCSSSELLSNNSLFVGQLKADKSLALRARDLIFFTTDLQTVNYYSTIHALELIYFYSYTQETMKQWYPSDSSNFPPLH